MWISLGLQRALSESNIVGGFWAIGIWPFNSHAIDSFLRPFRQFLETSTIPTETDNQETMMEIEHQDIENSQNEGDQD